MANYFKIMFINDYNLDPTLAKVNFNKKFPNIDLSGADVNIMIKNKYKESCKFNNNRIQNTEKLFKLYDNNGTKISKVIEFDNNKENNNIKDKFILIANDKMIENLSNNLVTQYFMDCTYKAVPPSTPRYKLMVITAFENHTNKTLISALYCYIKKMNIHLNLYLIT